MKLQTILSFAIGPIASAVLGFVTLPIITWYFTVEDIGRLAMLNVVVSLSILVFSLGLDQAYVREFHEAKNRPALLISAMAPGLAVLIITLVIFLSFDNVISFWLFDLNSRILSLFVATAILSAFISRFLSLILRMNGRGLAFSLSQILPKLILILIILGYIVLSLPKNTTNLVLANVVATLLVCLAYGWNTRRELLAGLKEKVDFARLRDLLRFGTPLIFGGLAFWGLSATDKILLKEFSNLEQLGLYSVAVSFAAAATIFQSIFSTLWAPTVYQWASQNKNLGKINLIIKYVLLAITLLFCLSGLFSWVVALILPSNYLSVQWILISCLGFPLLYTLSETTVVGIGITKRSEFSMLAAILALVINLTGNLWLVPKYGASGAAASTCVSFWFFFILRTEFSIYLWKSIPRKMLYSYSSILVSGAVLNTLFGKDYHSYFQGFWLVILLSVFLFFRAEIKDIKRWVVLVSKKRKNNTVV